MEVILEYCALKLRAPSRQFDGQASAAIQAIDQPLCDDSFVRRVFRADCGWQDDVFQTQDGRVPQRKRNRCGRGKTARGVRLRARGGRGSRSAS